MGNCSNHNSEYYVRLHYQSNYTICWFLYYKSFLSSRKKRIATLKKEYRKRKRTKDDPTLMIVEAINWLGTFLVVIVFMLFSVGLLVFVIFINTSEFISTPLSSFAITSSTIVFFIALVSLYVLDAAVLIQHRRFYRAIGSWREFEDFKKETIAKIQKLGGNPEDLDKEEAE